MTSNKLIEQHKCRSSIQTKHHAQSGVGKPNAAEFGMHAFILGAQSFPETFNRTDNAVDHTRMV